MATDPKAGRHSHQIATRPRKGRARQLDQACVGGCSPRRPHILATFGTLFTCQRAMLPAGPADEHRRSVSHFAPASSPQLRAWAGPTIQGVRCGLGLPQAAQQNTDFSLAKSASKGVARYEGTCNKGGSTVESRNRTHTSPLAIATIPHPARLSSGEPRKK